jgi:ABC-2 type transport system permease protein
MANEGGALLPGLGELLRKEVLEARRSKRALIFVLVMTGVMLLIPLIAFYNTDDLGGGARRVVSEEDMEAIVGSWAGIMAYLGSLMVIASTVDAMSYERSSGITAWIVTKPVARVSYLLAKALGHALVSAATVVVVPSLIWLVVTSLLFAEIQYALVFWAMTIMFVEVLFLTFCIVALGVPLRAVVWVALISLGLWFIPVAAPAVTALEWSYRVLPSYLPIAVIAASLSGSATDSEVFTISVASLAIGGIVFLVAVLAFERQEL